MKTLLRHFALFLLLAVANLAGDIKDGSLNCYLLVGPSIAAKDENAPKSFAEFAADAG